MRIALMGSGWVMNLHAAGVAEHPRGDLVAVANWREESARALAQRFVIPRVTTDWSSIAEDPEIDAVIVGTPNALHAPQAVACLRAGKHVLVEKPMAMNVAEADDMVSAARASGAYLMVAHCWRFHEAVIAVRDRIARGELGEIVKTRGYGVHAEWGPSGWFTDPDLAGGGALVDMGVHAIDTVRFLLDDPMPERVCATVARRYGEYAVDDDDIVLIRWSNGTSSIVEAGWWHRQLPGLEADTEVYGTLGYTRIFPTSTPEGYDHTAQPMYSAQVRAFIDAILEGREPRPNGEDGRVVMRIVEEAYASAGWSG
jgi:predicted dehydrogenase